MPPNVIVPAPVMGPPVVVKPVLPPDTATDVTVPTPPALIHSTSDAPLLTAKTLPPLPVYDGSRFIRALPAVVAPVPPLARARVPESVSVPEDVIGPPENDIPVVPPDALTDVTVPEPPEAAMVTLPAPLVIVMPEPAVRLWFSHRVVDSL